MRNRRCSTLLFAQKLQGADLGGAFIRHVVTNLPLLCSLPLHVWGGILINTCHYAAATCTQQVNHPSHFG